MLFLAMRILFLVINFKSLVSILEKDLLLYKLIYSCLSSNLQINVVIIYVPLSITINFNEKKVLTL